MTTRINLAILSGILLSVSTLFPGGAHVRADESAEAMETASLSAAETTRLNPLVSVGALTTEDYTEGIGDVVIPLYVHDEGAVLFNPRFSFTDRNAEEYNIGVGYRHLLSDGQAVGGVNAFYDRRETARGASFDQVGFGLEYLTHWVDLRANTYLPIDRKELINEFETVEESVSRSSTTSTALEWEAPQAVGNEVIQDLNVVRTTQTRTTTRTTTRLFREYELALRGWDTELGVRWPIDALEEYVRVKSFAGYYRYYGRQGLEDVEGFRGRLEVHIKPSFFIDAVYYADDELTGGNYSIGAYVSLPFDLANLASGKNPFAGATERWEADRRPDNLRHRLVDMVQRDPQIRTLIGEPEEQTEETTTTTQSRVRTDRSVESTTTETVATDITFVDATRGDDSNPGTFEDPKATVQGGVDEPRSMVFVFDIGGPYNEVVTMTDNVILRGEGAPIQANYGMAFGNGTHPLIDGGGAGPTITMADNTTVMGFEIANTVAGAPVGDGIFSATGENLVIAENIIHDTVHGVHVNTVGDVAVLLQDNQFHDNLASGATINGTGASGSYFVNANNNSFMNNGTYGLHLIADNYDDALAVVSGLEASGNVFGLNADMTADFISLLTLGDIQAGHNQFGVFADIESVNGFAAVVGGVPDELLDFVNEEFLGGAPASPELDALLASGGPIQVNSNTFMGMQLNVEGDILAAAGLLDVQANSNGDYGVDADVMSPNGVALGLVGSSENLMEVAQLGADVLALLGLPLPELPAPPAVGPAQFNDNGVTGLRLHTEGDFLSLAGALGVEAHRNQSFAGVDLSSTSTNGVALTLGGRIWADDNQVAGVNTRTEGDFLGLAALLDVHATDNGVMGIDMSVEGDGAVGLIASTDPLRSLVDILNDELSLDPALAIPGAPFGPVVASDNGIMGINANIQGDFLALGAFMDVRANDNGVFGINANITSDAGGAIGVFASSDQLFELAPPLLGELLLGDPNAIPVPAFTPMGRMETTGNLGGGLFANVEGDDLAVVLAGGIDASGNEDFTAPGNGITLVADSPDGGVVMGLRDVVAGYNAGAGMVLELSAEDEVTAAILDSEATGNVQEGIILEAETDFNDIYAILAGVNAHENGLQGFSLDLNSGEDLGVAITDVHASDNGRHGFRLNGTADSEAFVGVGDLASADLESAFGLSGLTNIVDVAGSTGPSSFNRNGIDPLDPGARAGLRIDLETDGDITVAAEGNTFNGNTGRGVHLDLESNDGSVSAALKNNTASGNALGILITANASTDPGERASVSLEGNEAATNDNAGARVNLSGDEQVLFASDNRFINNNLGFRLDTTAGASLYSLNVGDAGGGTAGFNAFAGNANRDLRFNGSGTLLAENNWWGANSDPDVDGKIVGSGTVDADPWLASDPF